MPRKKVTRPNKKPFNSGFFYRANFLTQNARGYRAVIIYDENVYIKQCIIYSGRYPKLYVRRLNMSVMSEQENKYSCKKDLVTLLLDNRVILQGKFKFRKKDDKDKDDNKQSKGFVFLELRCFPALLTNEAEIMTINPPLYEIGEIVRINVNEIASVGTSKECLGEYEDNEEDNWEDPA